MDLSEQIETVRLHLRSLCERLSTVTAVTKGERFEMGTLMLWADRVAARCEELSEARNPRTAK